MQLEIANVAAHCALQGFRYMAFPALVFEPPEAAPAALPEPEPVTIAAAAMVEAVPQVPTRRPRGIALLDDIAPAPRPAADSMPARRPPGVAEVRRVPRVTPQRVAPVLRDAAPGRAGREPPAAPRPREPDAPRADRAARYALLRDLSDDRR